MNATPEKQRREYFSGTRAERLEAAHSALCRLLAVQSCSKREKAKALREIELTAKRMADGIEQRLAQDERAA